MAKPVHRFVAVDRGEGNIHRWTPTCACGLWWGHHRRTRADAKDEWRKHERSTRLHRQPRRRARTGPQPRPVTPHDQLPKELQ